MVNNTIISRYEIDSLIKDLIRRFVDINKDQYSLTHSIFARKSILWKFSNRMTRAAGYAYTNNTMKFSAKIFAEMSTEEIYNTVAHETAHVIQNILFPNSKPHGIEWKRIMLDLGYEPKIYHNVVIKEQRQYTASCKCRSHAIGKIRYNKMRYGLMTYRCKLCKSDIKIQE